MKRWLAVCALFAGALGAAAQSRTLWQIGRFDHSSREFHDSFGVDYTSDSSAVKFVVGQSTNDAWLRFQPGPANGVAGGRLHPFNIRFSLAEAPHGTYALRIAVLYETPRLSTLRVEINGHAGDLRFQPRLDYAAGDWEGTFVPQTSSAERTILLPAAWLHTGENRVVLTALDVPETPQNSQGDIAPGESGIVYDALSLTEHVRAVRPSVHLSATPTIFFTRAEADLREQVEVCADAEAGARLPLQLGMHAGSYAQTVPITGPTHEFGDSCAMFEVPEWTGTRSAELSAGETRETVSLTAQKKWTILVVPHEHLDIGFTDYRQKVAELQSQSLDGVLDLLPQHPEFRWTMDGSWVADQFLSSRSPQRVHQFFDAVRAGQIIVPQQYANLHTGVASLEGLARSLYFSHTLAREQGLPVGAANITDVPSYSWSYASILHDAGVRYFAAASNSWRAPIMLQGRWNEKSPFYWEGPDGGRVLMWYSRAYLQLASMFGVPPTTEAVHDALPVFLQAYERAAYHASSVILFGSQLENTTLDRAQVTLPGEWAKTYAFPRLQFSTFGDALKDIEHQFGGSIPTYRGDFGPYWEDGFTSDAHATAVHRANQQRFLNAEVMSTVPFLLDRNVHADDATLSDAWKNTTLFDEHTWTAVSATTQPEGDQNLRQSAEKRRQPDRAADDLNDTIERSFAQLEAHIAPKEASVLVFNSLAWPRSGWLEADLPDGVQIVDPETRKPVAQYELRVEKGTVLPGFGGRTHRVRFRAEDVPAIGYKLFPMRVAAIATNAAGGSAHSNTVLENAFYRVTLDPESAGIRSIWDKELQRELVDPTAPFRFGSYVYVTGADDMPNNSLYRYGAGLPVPQLASHPASHGTLMSVEAHPGEQVAVLEASAPNTPSIRTEITLPDDAKRIDLRVTVRKNATLSREAVYIAFPFASRAPQFSYDTQTGWVDPARDELAGGSHEWYAAQHWAAVHDEGASMGVICVDAPMVALGDIVRGTWPTSFSPHSSSVFSWLMSNYWSTNFMASQGGEVTERYSIVSSRSFDPATLTRTAWQAMTPLESDMVSASAHPQEPATQSFLQIDNKDVALTTWKRAEDRTGTILRLVELAGHEQSVHVHVPAGITKTATCSLLEDCSQPVAVTDSGVSLTMHPFSIVTLKLMREAQSSQ